MRPIAPDGSWLPILMLVTREALGWSATSHL
jgi:hypothetical protein